MGYSHPYFIIRAFVTQISFFFFFLRWLCPNSISLKELKANRPCQFSGEHGALRLYGNELPLSFPPEISQVRRLWSGRQWWWLGEHATQHAPFGWTAVLPLNGRRKVRGPELGLMSSLIKGIERGQIIEKISPPSLPSWRDDKNSFFFPLRWLRLISLNILILNTLNKMFQLICVDELYILIAF